jgi:hypothetical protein
MGSHLLVSAFLSIHFHGVFSFRLRFSCRPHKPAANSAGGRRHPKGTPAGRPAWQAFFVKGDKPNRAASSCKKHTMKTDKNSRTTITPGARSHPEQAFPNRNTGGINHE